MIQTDILSARSNWNELPIDGTTFKRLRELAEWLQLSMHEPARIRTARGERRGRRVLFSGPDSISKLSAAALVAADAGCLVRRIDLATLLTPDSSQVPRALWQLFCSAEQDNSVLFFDNADVLMPDVPHEPLVHDVLTEEWSNYLMQRMDRFDGLALMSTGSGPAGSMAFQRRFSQVFEFTSVDADSAQVDAGKTMA